MSQSELYLEKRTTVLGALSQKLRKFKVNGAIPGLSDEVNTEIYIMNEEFSSHQNEQGDADDTADSASASVNLDRSVEEVVVHEYFNGSPCCALGSKKAPCWACAGKERFLHARQESLDLEKKELDLVVLVTLRASRSLPNDPSVSPSPP